MPRKQQLKLPALAITQRGGKTLYSFAVDGKQLTSFATVSRVHRDDDHQIGGYQRPEAIAHIRAIRNYLETPDAILPNALVVAFDSRVRFEPAARKRVDGAHTGQLVIPIDERLEDEEKPGWVVDGQQRSAAIRDANIDSFPVFVIAFITDSVAEQRSQFILVNSTKPLPKGLIHELLPATPESDLPIPLLKRRYPAMLLDRLNYDTDSPLFRRIRTPTTVEGTIKDNSMLKSIEMSIEDGALYAYMDSDTGRGDTKAMLNVLKAFWAAVPDVFPDAWNGSPRNSRLVHGVGIVSLTCLMDEITYHHRHEGFLTQERYVEELRRIHKICRWTAGSWDFAGEERRWNELQNTPQDIRVLSDYLVRAYRRQLRPAGERHAAVA